MKDLVAVDFDPFSHADDVKANPAHYVSTTELMTLTQARINLRRAGSLEALKKLWTEALKRFPETEDRKWLTIAKDKRKAELEAENATS